MRFFFVVKGRSLAERGVRAVAMLLVVAVVIWAFWKNNETVVHRILETQAYWDETRETTHEHRRFARDFASSLKEAFGIKARVQILKEDIEEPSLGESEVYLGIVPSKKQVMLRITPEGEKERELIEYMQTCHFEEYWGDQWAEALQPALVLIWSNFSGERKGFMDVVSSNTVIEDQTHSLSSDDMEFLGRFAAGLEEEFGQKAVIRVFTGAVLVPDLDSRTMFLGISPGSEEVLVSFPPLISRSLPAGFVEDLRGPHFEPYFKNGNWDEGLKTALVQIWKGLADRNVPEIQ